MTEEDTLYRWTMNVSEISSISEEEEKPFSLSLFSLSLREKKVRKIYLNTDDNVSRSLRKVERKYPKFHFPLSTRSNHCRFFFFFSLYIYISISIDPPDNYWCGFNGNTETRRIESRWWIHSVRITNLSR